MTTKVEKTEDEWRAILSPEQFRILREKGTERANTGEYDKHYEEGVYNCAGCGTPLYKSTTKFKFNFKFIFRVAAVGLHSLTLSLAPSSAMWTTPGGMTRTEIVCTACGGHLGHVFKGEKFDTPTDERHCVNSVSLKFEQGDGVEKSQ
ncbi:Peptide-methionine (R)-S-oxide reductase [Mycena sanguinolenta]|uniref:Peptide-methionine (R)-S-oxide reductase n=1 Tax=Mycena sanguinolenta TaxID=230812 RepID=A0A8H6Z448_9AGAR|nr:Peptide-methionine (R)-S-oxide reductase [Mycena sanguinolenta]